MTGAEAITQLISYGINTSASDADQTDRRERVRLWLQETKDYVVAYRQWMFLFDEDSLTVPTTGAVAMPSDFGSIPSWGGVFDSTTGAPIPQASPQEVLALRSVATNSDVIPRCYAIFGVNGSNLPYLQTPRLGASRALLVKHMNKSTAITDDSAATGLGQIPAQWHQLVLIPGARRFQKHSAGDARTQDFSAQFQQGLRLMVREEPRMRDTTTQLPSFFGR